MYNKKINLKCKYWKNLKFRVLIKVKVTFIYKKRPFERFCLFIFIKGLKRPWNKEVTVFKLNSSHFVLF